VIAFHTEVQALLGFRRRCAGRDGGEMCGPGLRRRGFSRAAKGLILSLDPAPGWEISDGISARRRPYMA